MWEADTRPVLMTNHVLGETWTFLSRRLGHAAAVEFLSRAERSHRLTVVHIDEPLEAEAWRWSGPEVTREYPPDSDIGHIRPDSEGFRTVRYKVHLIYRDQGGRVTRVESFTALDMLFANPRK